jgi:hypothetical protein
MTAFIQKPGLTAVAPVYTACTATDSFSASPNGKYMLHYKNAATVTGALKAVDQTSANSIAPAGAVLAGGWADAQLAASIAASGEGVCWIDTAARFRDGAGKINLTHVTPTTLTLAIFGPF